MPDPAQALRTSNELLHLVHPPRRDRSRQLERDLQRDTGMSNQPSIWDEVRQIADELELKIHLAGMDARDQWRALKPKITDIEQRIASSSEQAGQAITKELTAMGDALRKLRDEVYDEMHELKH